MSVKISEKKCENKQKLKADKLSNQFTARRVRIVRAGVLAL